MLPCFNCSFRFTPTCSQPRRELTGERGTRGSIKPSMFSPSPVFCFIFFLKAHHHSLCLYVLPHVAYVCVIDNTGFIYTLYNRVEEEENVFFMHIDFTHQQMMLEIQILFIREQTCMIINQVHISAQPTMFNSQEKTTAATGKLTITATD